MKGRLLNREAVVTTLNDNRIEAGVQFTFQIDENCHFDFDKKSIRSMPCEVHVVERNMNRAVLGFYPQVTPVKPFIDLHIESALHERLMNFDTTSCDLRLTVWKHDDELNAGQWQEHLEDWRDSAGRTIPVRTTSWNVNTNIPNQRMALKFQYLFEDRPHDWQKDIHSTSIEVAQLKFFTKAIGIGVLVTAAMVCYLVARL